MYKQHNYSLLVQWTGNSGCGTESYRSYERSHTVVIDGKPPLECSSYIAFRGDKTKFTPEELLVASLSGCHMLWYLHLCAEAGVVVVDYTDKAIGTMSENERGGQFTEVSLHPTVKVAEASMVEKALALHTRANELCFIAKSVNFPVYHHPSCQVQI